VTSTWANDSVVQLYNTAEQGIAQTLAADGLNIGYVDINKYYDWAGIVQGTSTSQADGVHPSQIGHQEWANAVQDALNPYLLPKYKTLLDYLGSMVNSLPNIYSGSGTSTAIIQPPASVGIDPYDFSNASNTSEFHVSMASTTLKLGFSQAVPGCLQRVDVTNGTKWWSYISAGVEVTTSTLPSFCQNLP